jgi:putative endonuclease
VCSQAPSTGDPRRRLGALGEGLAAEHMRRLGFELVARNVRTRYGEIDLIAFDGSVLAFVEVKTRRARGRRLPEAGSRPLDWLSRAQQKRLRRLSRAWLCAHGPPQGRRAREIRFDAVGVIVDERDRLMRLDHVQGGW